MKDLSACGRPFLCLTWLLSAISALRGADDLSEELRGLVQETKVPALACAVIVDGEIAALGAAGIRRLGSPEEVTIEDKWHLGSCTKTWTATLAALLVDEGVIRWDSTVSEVLKGIRIHEGFRQATLFQFVSNTGGTPKEVPQRIWAAAWQAKGPSPRQRLSFVGAMLAEEPRYVPGEGYEYSNTGFAVAGTMLEKAAGKPYEQLMQERIFKPLELQGAGFHAPASRGKVDQPYGHNDKGPVAPIPAGDNPPAIASAGGIHCRIEDWAKFVQVHMGSSKNLVLTDEQQHFFRTPVSPVENYAPGWFILRRSWARGPVLNHLGSNTMWYSAVWLAPEERFAVLVVTNLGTDQGEAACELAASRMLRKYGPGNR